MRLKGHFMVWLGFRGGAVHGGEGDSCVGCCCQSGWKELFKVGNTVKVSFFFWAEALNKNKSPHQNLSEGCVLRVGRKQSFLNWQGQRWYFNWSLTLKTKSCCNYRPVLSWVLTTQLLLGMRSSFFRAGAKNATTKIKSSCKDEKLELGSLSH